MRPDAGNTGEGFGPFFMQYNTFFIPLMDDGEAQEELNAFLRSKRVLSVDKAFINSGWSFCVEWLEGGKSIESGNRSKPKVDYRDVLSAEDFSVFAKLRERRKELAQQDGVQVYAVMTNEQLAEMVRLNVSSVDDLKCVKGVGDARIQKYGADLVEALMTAKRTACG